MTLEYLTDALFDGFSNIALVIIGLAFLYIILSTLLDVAECVIDALFLKDPPTEQEPEDNDSPAGKQGP